MLSIIAIRSDMECSWKPLGSDHFSLSYATPIACATLHQPRWKFDQADWETFRTQADITEDMVSSGSIDEAQWSLINTIPEIAETFAKTSSCNNYTPAFQALKRREERVKLNFSSSNEEGYNSPLTLLELRIALHRSDLKIRSAKALNILKVLTNTRWGADRTSLLRFYRALIRSKLDYGSVVYSSACKSLLKILDPVHHQGLRLCLGAFRTSPVESLYAEAYELPLDLRRKYLCVNHFMKIQSMKTNTAYSYLFNFSLYDFNSHHSSLTYSQPFHFRIRDLINDLNLNIGRIALCKISELPPWKGIYPKVDFTLSCYSKAYTPVSTYRTLYLEHRELFSDYEPIFMDGSKSESHVGSAVVSRSTVITDALPISASIYTAELHALRIAIEHISLSRGKKFIIYRLPVSPSKHCLFTFIVSSHSCGHHICFS
ncbi:putative RNA-directed DNA polymerase from transposon BS [Trichonephila clavata]|uniref:Putative RNA-directed DNA polymerase from transposon BS n=1 Tax=Trichonephila clavata TaxID=2740835 RepID=A0A8X6HAB5_TRICU|nr:putative RNA-directed DNA polymerase from transposon BS [Trichonephila clavata]